MLKNDKASVVSVTIVDYDDHLESYVVKYEVLVKSGVMRRRTALYKPGEGLSSDQANERLVERIKQEIPLFDRGVKNKHWR